MYDVQNLHTVETTNPTDVVAKLAASRSTHRYARIALRIAHSFMVGKAYNRDLAGVTNDICIIATQVGHRTWKTRREINAIVRLAQDMKS